MVAKLKSVSVSSIELVMLFCLFLQMTYIATHLFKSTKWSSSELRLRNYKMFDEKPLKIVNALFSSFARKAAVYFVLMIFTIRSQYIKAILKN